MSEHVNVPTREEIAQKLQQLIADELTREAASNWASPWITQFHELKGLDRKVKDGLEVLAMADTPTTDRPYLYGPQDFVAWLRELLA